ncbi:Crp/Fnr family transcriptional regulator [Spirochaeta cellobiosiphila]|uniref:Crp/Fnr family transcriptional regulator n=1 Tax=Spirochaeta cellobiosiphila TaxID=504483 RepID=UPI0004080E49|nr:cyclic nucleotide-binding domain-containing protein [Spirochaeta cellobiosiphila]
MEDLIRDYIQVLYKRIDPKYDISENNLQSWLLSFYQMLNQLAVLPYEKVKTGLSILKYQRINSGEHFVHIDTTPDKLAFIANGLFRVYYISDDGSEKILVFRGKGSMLSAFSAFLENRKSWFGIQALETSDLIYITFNDYQKQIQSDSYWQIVNSRYIELLFVEKEKRERELLSDNAETRYKHF